MPLYLVGENIDALNAHRRAAAGELVSVSRGVYIDAAEDVDATLRAHGIRIAHFLYPKAYLCSASAINLAPSDDGRLFLAGKRNQRNRLRTLEIIQTQAPPRPSVDRAIIGDPMGEFTMSVSSPQQRLLEAFRLRSEQASAITAPMRRAIADRLIAEHGSPGAAADALWTLARTNDWFREGEGAERYLRDTKTPAPAALNHAAFALQVAWHGGVIGTLAHDGHEWRWNPSDKPNPPLVRETVPGSLPPFIESLLPEGWLKQVLAKPDQRAALRDGRRYMSNVTISADAKELKRLPLDVLKGRIADYRRAGLFTGHYEGPGRQHYDEPFEHNLARIFSKGTTPRLSGVQIKAPMFLDRDGIVMPATDLPFTHILKPAGTSGFEQMPVVEWLCLQFASAAGFEVAETALIEMPEDMPPALLVERFDIRTKPEDKRRFAMEDFCSILDLPADDKYKGTIERMARGMRSLSTDPAADLATLFSRAVFAWLIADGDMHLKNIAILKVAGAQGHSFESVRMAPVYDALTTRVFPGLETDHMALKLAGKDERLDLKAFETLARTIELPLGETRAIIARLTEVLTNARSIVALPEVIALRPAVMATVERVVEIAEGRSRALGAEFG
jgi:serine/threonine-protein kinase HipA